MAKSILNIYNAYYPCSLNFPKTVACHFVYVRMNLKHGGVLDQWGERRGDQPAHVERHDCSLMWLQLGKS